MTIEFRIVPLLLVLIFSVNSGVAHAQTTDDLEQAVGTPAFPSLIEDALAHAPTIEAVERVVKNYIPQVESTEEQVSLLMRAASQYELSHHFDKAKRTYLQARLLQPRNAEIAIRLGSVLIEEGSVQESIIILTNAMHAAQTRALQRRASIFRARAYYLSGNIDQAVIQLRSLTGIDRASHPSIRDLVEAEAFALLAEIASSQNMTDLYELTITRLRELFPHAPETMLLAESNGPHEDGYTRERILYYPSPSRIASGSPYEMNETLRVTPLAASQRDESEGEVESDTMDDVSVPTEPTDIKRPVVNMPAGIQTGSFRDRENAQYMALDIEEYGFDVQVKEVELNGRIYYRVIVPVADDSTSPQELVVALKERGIEGFLVFE